MGDRSAAVTYDSSLLVAMPRTLFYGSLLAGVHGWFALVGFDGVVSPAIGVAAVVFLAVLALTVGMAVYGYRRRYYEFREEGMTEHRWALRPVESNLAYENIEDITMTQTWVQSLLDGATIRLNHIESDTVGDEEAMRLRFVSEPGAVYSELLSRCAEFHDPVPRKDVADRFETHSIEEASAFSSEQAAAATGATYLMPYAVIEPRIRPILRAFAVHGLPRITILTAPVIYALFISELFTPLRAVGVWVLLYFGYLGYGLWTRGRIQYELYSEYLKIIEGDDAQTVGYDDIVSVKSTTGGLVYGASGRVIGLDENGDEAVEIAYASDTESVADGLAEIADADRE